MPPGLRCAARRPSKAFRCRAQREGLRQLPNVPKFCDEMR
jgi:hypothetical protein